MTAVEQLDVAGPIGNNNGPIKEIHLLNSKMSISHKFFSFLLSCFSLQMFIHSNSILMVGL